MNKLTRISRMMQRLTLGAALLLPALAGAQNNVGIGTTAPDASAALDVVASGKGALLPRLTQAARLAMGIGAVPPPAPGLIVYQTDGTQPGFWYNSGSAAAPRWVRLADSDGVSFDPITGLTVGLNGSAAHQLGVQSVANTGISPYYSEAAGDQRTQYVFRKVALSGAGLVAGPIRSLSFTVTTKNSTGSYQGFTLKLANTLNATAAAPFLTSGVTTVHSATTATYLGINTYTLTAPFTWNGTSNLYLEVCFDNTTPVGTDAIAGQPINYQALFQYYNVPVGCTATSGLQFTGNFIPIVQFGQGPAPYTLPQAQGLPGQVLTQQAGGAVTFQDPQWTQTGTDLAPTVAGSDVKINGQYTYAAPQTHTVGLSASEFLPETNQTSYSMQSSDEVYNTSVSNRVLRTTLHLPQGAVITQVDMWSHNASSFNMTIELVSFNYTSQVSVGRPVLASATTTGQSGLYVRGQAPLAVPAVVDNDNYTYSLRVTWSGLSSPASSLALCGARVTYTTTRAEQETNYQSD